MCRFEYCIYKRFLSSGSISLDLSVIHKLPKVYSDFSSMNETVNSNPKWQDKVEVLEQFNKYIETHQSSFSSNQEAVIQYVMIFSKDFKAANINILKTALVILKTIISCCGAGPRACQPVISACVSKVHDKKLGPDIISLLSTIAEKIGPDTVMNQVKAV